MTILIVAVLLGIIPAAIAQSKGRSFVLWWLYGSLLFIIALPNSLIISAKGQKKCPACAEMVKSEANICKHCGSALGPDVKKELKPNPKTKAKAQVAAIVIYAVIFAVAAGIYFGAFA